MRRFTRSLLIPCTVDLFGAAATATLGEGRVEVIDSGDVDIDVEGSSLTSATLTLSFQTIEVAVPICSNPLPQELCRAFSHFCM